MRRSIATPATRGQGLEPTQEIPNGFPDAGPVVALAARPATDLGGASRLTTRSIVMATILCRHPCDLNRDGRTGLRGEASGAG